MENLPNDVRRAYHNLANDPKYRHFVHIPERILCCLDYFGVACTREETSDRLLSYYLFIGVVDSVIDSGYVEVGEKIIEQLSRQTPFPNEEMGSLKLVTLILKGHISEESYPLMMSGFRELYQQVVSERAATSIDAYIEHRKAVGRLTAELSYLLIRPNLNDDNGKLCEFMKQVGAIGCLVDSLIDLSADRRLGLLGFEPGPMDYTKLAARILRDGLRVTLKHLGLSGLFLRAIVDNVRDRFRDHHSLLQHSFVSDRKDAPAGVA